MTAVPIHRPEHVDAGAVAAPARLRLVPPLGSSMATPRTIDGPRAARVRLTARGHLVARMAVLLGLVVAGVLIMLATSGLVGGTADAGTSPQHVTSRVVVVQPGQTLWQIAGQVAPGVDRRETIARIVELNALPESSVSAGERLAVPAR